MGQRSQVWDSGFTLQLGGQGWRDVRSQRADALNLNLNHVARLQELWRVETSANAGGSTRHEDVAGSKCHTRADAFDKVANVADHIRSTTRLAHFAVNARHDGKSARIGRAARQLRLWNDARSYWRKAIETFPQKPLLVSLLHVARGQVVDNGLPKHVLSGILLRNVLTTHANHNAKLSLVVHF